MYLGPLGSLGDSGPGTSSPVCGVNNSSLVEANVELSEMLPPQRASLTNTREAASRHGAGLNHPGVQWFAPEQQRSNNQHGDE